MLINDDSGDVKSDTAAADCSTGRQASIEQRVVAFIGRWTGELNDLNDPQCIF
jgi:hypothetical protein